MVIAEQNTSWVPACAGTTSLVLGATAVGDRSICGVGRDDRPYCALMFPCLITFAYLTISLSRCARNASGELPMAAMPSRLKNACTFSSCSTFLVSALILLTISGGVPLGKNVAYQTST